MKWHNKVPGLKKLPPPKVAASSMVHVGPYVNTALGICYIDVMFEVVVSMSQAVG